MQQLAKSRTKNSYATATISDVRAERDQLQAQVNALHAEVAQLRADVTETMRTWVDGYTKDRVNAAEVTAEVRRACLRTSAGAIRYAEDLFAECWSTRLRWWWNRHVRRTYVED